jgi:Domain of unknown function (DUF4062)
MTDGPRMFSGVMISSSFGDLVEYREALKRVIEKCGLYPVCMELSATPATGTIVDSSLRMVRDSAAYVLLIGNRYGQVPRSAALNPDQLSLTCLEFREAVRLGRPILVYITGRDYQAPAPETEEGREAKDKLAAFRAEAMRSVEDPLVQRVYRSFDNLRQFELDAMQDIAELCKQVVATPSQRAEPAPGAGAGGGVPVPPALYAVPPYLESRQFVGRDDQLGILDAWSGAADPCSVLLFEAIGGTGKSALTWEWVKRRAWTARPGGWSGMFWYSFYERGADMGDFRRQALAYMTGQSVHRLPRDRTELDRLLLERLRSRPWLIVLDGLERVLVSYHRHNAAQLADEQAGQAAAGDRGDPCAAISPDDDRLLRELSAASPSKTLVTSRLMPRSLLNESGQPRPGVKRVTLPGLRPADAEALLSNSGVRSEFGAAQRFLQRHCDCHPLVTGVIAGLVNNYLPDRGNFGAWAADPRYGGRLDRDLGRLDLPARRTHILQVALDGLPEGSARLLGLLSLLPESFDYELLYHLNPYRPPEHAAMPSRDSRRSLEPLFGELLKPGFRDMPDAHDQQLWGNPPKYKVPQADDKVDQLDVTVRDLERRGLLQYDPGARHWDLHPVVRAVAADRLGGARRNRDGQRIVDYFSQRPGNPYANARTLDDLSAPVTVVKTLLQLGRYQDAYRALDGDLSNALLWKTETYEVLIALLAPFFPAGWTAPPAVGIDQHDRSSLATVAAIAFSRLGKAEQARKLHQTAIGIYVWSYRWSATCTGLRNMATACEAAGQPALRARYTRMALRLAEGRGDPEQVFMCRLHQFAVLADLGRWAEAEAMWQLLDPMGRNWPLHLYRPGDAECSRLARLLFPLGRLTEEELVAAEGLPANRQLERWLHALRGEWHLSRGEYQLAIRSLGEAVRMANESGTPDPAAETLLVLARSQAGDDLSLVAEEAERLAAARLVSHLHLGRLWQALGNTDRAVGHATAAYQSAWADGEPYVRRHDLNRATLLLRELGADIPVLAPYEEDSYPRESWEEAIEQVIDRLEVAARDRGQPAI